MQKIRIFSLLILLLIILRGENNLALNNPAIRYEGVWYPIIDSSRVIFNRHTDRVLEHTESGISSTSRPYAYTQTGVRIKFKTASPYFCMEFEQRQEGGHLGLENGFAIYADSVRIAVKEKLKFTIDAPDSNRSILYTVLLPSLYAIDFTGLSIANGYKLEELAPDSKPVYAAIGNSITHGTGHQSASFLTYPYILADSMNWKLYNLAVTGARTGWPISLLFKDKNVDYITIALGFNDWMWDNKPLSDKFYQYKKLLDSLVYFQPEAKIFCITPLTTTKTETQLDAPFSLQDYRTMLIRHVSRRRNLGNQNIFILHGDSLSDASMLMDGIHLSKTGSPLFADRLVEEINKLLQSNNTSINSENPVELNFELKQNYPNPFNPSTNIQFYTKNTAEIELNILNLMGQKITTLFEGKVTRGFHRFNFKSHDLPNGIYLYRIESKDYNETKKMTILK